MSEPEVTVVRKNSLKQQETMKGIRLKKKKNSSALMKQSQDKHSVLCVLKAVQYKQIMF